MVPRTNDLFLTPALLEMAEREFPKLMRHRTNREDALQVLRMVQWRTGGVNPLPVAYEELILLEIDLGLRLPSTADVARQALAA